jgi:2-hydroxy-3-keto-5-methylthiopentenyl-1-phosphate phosphatase
MHRISSPRTRLRVAPTLPTPDAAQVWIDFDGTISSSDVLDELISEYANDGSWQELERQWQSGKIGSRECLLREFALLRISALELDRFLERIELDEGIHGLLHLLARHGVPFAILSDGVDLFIRKLLSRLDLPDVVVRANTITHEGQRISLVCPHGSGRCETGAAHCKCASAERLATPGRRTIYIGDGRSDLCPAQKADAVFAKNALAAALTKAGTPFIPFGTLDEVTTMLSNAWSLPVVQQIQNAAGNGTSANGDSANGNGRVEVATAPLATTTATLPREHMPREHLAERVLGNGSSNGGSSNGGSSNGIKPTLNTPSNHRPSSTANGRPGNGRPGDARPSDARPGDRLSGDRVVARPIAPPVAPLGRRTPTKGVVDVG